MLGNPDALITQDPSSSIKGPTPEEIILFTEGYESYEKMIPTLPRPRLIYYQGKNPYSISGASAQGETALMNLFYILLDERGVVDKQFIETLKEKIGGSSNPPFKSFLKFFQEHPYVCQGDTEIAQEKWSDDVLTNLNRYPGNKVDYVRDKICEIPASGGIINMLSVIGKLIPDPDLGALWDKDKKKS